MKRNGLCSRSSFQIMVALALGLIAVAWRASAKQATNPPYLVEMPTVDKVKSVIKGTSPDDTLAHQVAVFTYLPFVITRMQDPHRSVRAPNTPDEARIIGAYNLAAYQMSQAYAKTHTPEQAAEFERLHGRYEMDGNFINEWLKALFSPEFRAAYDRAVAGQLAEYRAHVAKQQQEYEQSQAQQRAAQMGGIGNGEYTSSNEKTSQTTRRCLELGGNELACLGKGFGAGLLDMVGFNLDAITGPKPAGLVMNGQYNGGNSKVSLRFSEGSVSISGCGNLVADDHGYMITKKTNQLLISVQNDPNAFVLVMGLDGRLAGPGPTEVSGRVITGYHHYWVQERYTSDGTIVPGSAHEESEPIYAPKTERCSISDFSPPPPPRAVTAPADNSDASLGLVGALVGAVGDIVGAVGPPGLRMTGQYSSPGGLALAFDPASVILDCGPAHVKQPYAVANKPNQILVTVQNAATPFTLAFEPNGALVGSGSTEVNGRLVSAVTDNGVKYTASQAVCAIGTLMPNAGAPATASVGTPSAPAPGSPVVSAPAAPASAVGPAVPQLPGANAALSVTSGYPARANPLAGKWIFLMKDRFDNVLRANGAPLPPGTTSRQAWQAMTQHCRPPVDCSKLYGGIATFFAAKMMMPANGAAEFSPKVRAGTYFVMGATTINNSSAVWDVKVVLKPGANSLTLDNRNEEPVK
jgi:hypothetical protein